MSEFRSLISHPFDKSKTPPKPEVPQAPKQDEE
jgi:hypothetical protein